MDWLSSGSVADGFDSDPAKDEYGTYNYCNEAFNALYRKAIATMDIKERKDLLFEMEKILCEDPATIMIGWNRQYVICKANLTGLLISGGDADYTYMDLAK
jgi:ABC-type transport system substrate-binding protein